MIIGMPISTFLAILIWPFVYITAAVIDYFIMKKQDAMVDDSEYEEHLEPKAKSKAKGKEAAE